MPAASEHHRQRQPPGEQPRRGWPGARRLAHAGSAENPNGRFGLDRASAVGWPIIKLDVALSSKFVLALLAAECSTSPDWCDGRRPEH